MKKYKILVYVFAIFTFIIPLDVMAKSNITFNCDLNKIGIGESSKCEIITNTDYDIGSYEFEIVKPDGVTIDFTTSDGWVSASGETVYGAINANGVKSGSIVGTLIITNNAAKSNVDDITIENIQLGLVGSSESKSSTSSPFIPIGIAAGVVVLGAIIIVVAKKKK